MNINWQKELFFSSNEREDEILINSPRKQTALTSMFSSKFLSSRKHVLVLLLVRVILQNWVGRIRGCEANETTSPLSLVKSSVVSRPFDCSLIDSLADKD